MKAKLFTILLALFGIMLLTSSQTKSIFELFPIMPLEGSTPQPQAPLLSAKIEYTQPTVNPSQTIADKMTEFASTLIGRRYVWGAVGPKTFDCSGFTSYVYKQHGINLPRTSRMQYTQGEDVDREQLRPGDLMFFSSPRSGRGNVGHVAMVSEVNKLTGKITFIHASTKKGISYQSFPDGGYYSRNYIGAKRIIPPTA